MKDIQLLLHRTIEYDAGDGIDQFRVTAASEWLDRADFEEFLKRVELGVFVVRVIERGKNEKIKSG